MDVELLPPNSDTTVLSVEQQNFSINENGTFIVPEVFVDKLVDVGFKRLPARIRVSQEAADAIAASAKKLNMPMPHITVVNDGGKVAYVSDGTPQGDLNKFLMETSGGFHATNEDWTTVGRDASGFPVPKGSPEDVTIGTKAEKTAEQLDMESQQRAGESAAQEAADAAKQAEEVAAGEGGPGKGEADPKTE